MVTQVATNIRIPALRIADEEDARSPEMRGWCARQEWRDPDGTLLASGGTAEGCCWMQWSSVGLFLFDPIGDEVIVHPVRGVSSSEIDDTYIRGVLPVALLAQGYEALHASAVEIQGRVVAFAAESGTGKSTLAAAVARICGTQWADDTTICSVNGPSPWSVALPFPQRLDAPARGALTNVPGDAVPAPHGAIAPLAAMYVVKRTELRVGYVEFSRVPEAVAFRRLLAHAHPLELIDGRSRQLIERMLLLASRVPLIELRIRSGLDYLPSVASLVSRHAASVHAV